MKFSVDDLRVRQVAEFAAEIGEDGMRALMAEVGGGAAGAMHAIRQVAMFAGLTVDRNLLTLLGQNGFSNCVD